MLDTVDRFSQRKGVPVNSHLQPEVAEELSLEGFGEEQVARAGAKPPDPGSGLAGAE